MLFASLTNDWEKKDILDNDELDNEEFTFRESDLGQVILSCSIKKKKMKNYKFWPRSNKWKTC